MKKAIIGLFTTLFTLLTLAAVAGYWGYQTLLSAAGDGFRRELRREPDRRGDAQAVPVRPLADVTGSRGGFGIDDHV